jgi:hypothetical protein
VHYDNPDKVQIRDSSGFKLYYTDELRANDAMIMTLGHLNINIPPAPRRTSIPMTAQLRAPAS